jgi:hypothetical protein
MADKKLWEIMRDAYFAAKHQSFFVSQGPRMGYAAELRAIANEVVPEEPKPVFYFYVDTDMGLMENIPARHRWEQRMATRAKLLKAAAEAEGET